MEDYGLMMIIDEGSYSKLLSTIVEDSWVMLIWMMDDYTLYNTELLTIVYHYLGLWSDVDLWLEDQMVMLT